MALAGREKSMGFVWFVVASLLIALVAWLAYDEVVGRRTWKHYAAEWQHMEELRLEKAIADAKKNLDKNQIKKLSLDKEKARFSMQSAEHQKAQDELKAKKIEYNDAKTRLQFTKADLDEAFYQWKHAQNQGHEFAAYKKRYDSLDQEVKKLTEQETAAEKLYLAAGEKAASFQEPLKALDAEEGKIFEKIRGLEKELAAVKDHGAPIQQVVVEDLGRNGPVHWGEVDRCTSCHIPTMTPGYEKNKNPFKTHPNLEKIFSAHPVEEYGCVTCHGGQGRATQFKGKPLEKGDFAHGFEKHWLNPLLRGDYMQSSCNKCHVQQFSLDLAPVYTEGKQIFVNYGCINCHKINGLEWAPQSGPDLAKIKDKVYLEWLYAWVKKPTDYLPNTRMPQPPWHDEKDVHKALAYILAQSESFDFKYGDFPGGDAGAGKQLFSSIGCFACHNIGGQGGGAAPALDRIAEKTTAKWIYNWIQEPKNWSTHARMPSLRLSTEEAKNLTAYLMTLGHAPAEDAKLRAAFADEANIKAGYNVINTYGCYACHNIKGFEKSSRPSVELSNYGRKDPHEFDFGDAKIPMTWEAWTDGKLKNPQMYVTERSSSYMPKPNINDEQRHALLVFLKGQKPENIPAKYTAYDAEVEAGRQLVNQYNCKACHVIEGQGGDVSKWITEPNDLPPNLASTGARLQTAWMYSFLKNPASHPKVRDWLTIRMPTFGFTDDEADKLVKYFKKQAGVPSLLEATPEGNITQQNLEAAQSLTGTGNFYCASCHIVGNERPAAGPTVWAPNLAYGDNRLRPQWINAWIRNPGNFVPGIRMPGYYSEPGSGPKDILGGDDEKQIQAIVDYIMYLGKKGAVLNSAAPVQTSAQDSQSQAPQVPKPESAPVPSPVPEAGR